MHYRNLNVISTTGIPRNIPMVRVQKRQCPLGPSGPTTFQKPVLKLKTRVALCVGNMGK